MLITGCDFHTRYQQIAMANDETAELLQWVLLQSPLKVKGPPKTVLAHQVSATLSRITGTSLFRYEKSCRQRLNSHALRHKPVRDHRSQRILGHPMLLSIHFNIDAQFS